MIPRLIHFVLLAPMQFDWLHWIAVATARDRNPDMQIILWADRKPSGQWWDRAEPFVDVQIREAPGEVSGFTVRHPAHRSDLLRLDVLDTHGGIYLDLDVLTVRSYEPLLNAQFVMGAEGIAGRYGLCNAVIMAAPGSDFLQAWRAGYEPSTSQWQGFRSVGRDEYWNELSVQYPSMLSEQMPKSISVMPFTAFHWPTWEAEYLRLLFEPTFADFPDAFCHHLWATFSWPKYLQEIDPRKGLLDDGSRFAQLAGPHLGWRESDREAEQASRRSEVAANERVAGRQQPMARANV